MPRAIFYNLILFLFLSSISSAQTRIYGKVTDSKLNPMPGANIYIKDTYDGVTSKEDGSYSFKTSEKGEVTLVASYVGYKKVETKISLKKGDLKFDIILEEEITEMNAVVVSAGSFEASDEKKGVILRPLDVVTTGTEADLYRTLETLPGTQKIGNTEGLFVRGGSASETKTIIDEMIVQRPFFTSIPDLPSRGRFSPMLFKGTLFSTGGYSAQYGQALSSVLILRTQDLPAENSTAINLMVFGFGGAHTERWENSSLSYEGMYYNLGPYVNVFPQRINYDESPNGSQSMLNYRYKISKTGLIKLFASYEHSSFSLFEKNLDNFGLDDHIKLKSDNYYLNANYKDVWGDDWVVFTGISGSVDKDWIDFNADKVQSFVNLGQLKFTLSKKFLPGSYITIGSEGQFSKYDDRLNQYGVGLNENFIAGFVETDILFSNDLAAKIGIRSEHSKSLNKYNFAPRISFAYRLGNYDQLNLAYGKFYQTPEKDFLLYSNDFNYESADHYIVNYQYLGDRRTFRIEFYYKDYNNLAKGSVNTYPFMNVPPLPYSSNGKGYAKGIDVFWRDSKTFQYTDYWISYSYLDTKRDYRNFPVSTTPPFAAPHTFSLVFKRWVESINSMVGITYSLAAGRPYFNPNNSEFLGDRTPVYHNLSANISYVFNLFNNFTVIFFSIDNVPGINNVFGYRYSNDGKISEPIVAPALRSVFLGMFISLGQKNPYQ